MTRVIVLIILFYGALVCGQESHVPDMFPPSPTVYNLMKFEEIPVNNYTGVPEITIPISSINTGIAGLPLKVSINYHTYNAKSDSKASEVGLGWSLLAGGSISRTVMGSPDEKVTTLGHNRKKVGIYYDAATSPFPSHKNYASTVIANAAPPGGINMNQTIFDSYFINKYDTQYDLYQYNFLNYTGRFIVKKSGGLLVAQKLDINNLMIKVNYSNTVTVQEAFSPYSFEITDEFGNLFIFDVTETSTVNTFSSRQGPSMALGLSGSTTASNFNSAYHLSSIRKFDQEFVQFHYNAPLEVRTSDNTSYRNHYNPDVDIQQPGVEVNLALLPPYSESSSYTVTTQTKTLQKIKVINVGEINFEYETGRLDTNLGQGTNLSKLKSVTVQNAALNFNEKYEFSHIYMQKGTAKRLFLTSVTKKNKLPGTADFIGQHSYNLGYVGDPNEFSVIIPPDLRAGSDSFFRCPYANDGDQYKKCAGIEVLRSITFPTKGKVEFDFEPNTFSYIPPTTTELVTEAEKLTNFDANPLNWDYISNITHFNNFNSGYKYGFTLSQLSTTVRVDINTAAINGGNGWNLKYYRKQGSSYVLVDNITNLFYENQNPPESIYLLDLPPGQYYFELLNGHGGSSAVFYASFTFNFSERNMNNYQYLFDFRGIRIKNLAYYDNTVSSDPFQIPNPLKSITYNYHESTDSKVSSGALVLPFPVSAYQEYYRAVLEYRIGQLGSLVTSNFQTTMTRSTDKNFLPVQKTKGSDVGYQYVTVSEIGKGTTVYQYTSPKDAPNEYTLATSYPFMPAPNYDYKRGLLVNRKVYSNINDLLDESIYRYEYSTDTVMTGFDFSPISNGSGYFLYGAKYPDYTSFLNYVSGMVGAAPYFGPNVLSYLAVKNHSDLFGTANLVQEDLVQYYPNQQSIKTRTLTGYNVRNLPITRDITLADHSVQTTSYKYAHEKGNSKLISSNMIAMPLETVVIKKKDSLDIGNQISKMETLYDDPTHKFPTSVKSTDIKDQLGATEVTYDRYDAKGNLLQYTSRSGIPTAIIWGYGSTQPVAKIEGAGYDQVKNDALVTAVVAAATDDQLQGTDVSEHSLITALDNLRKGAGFNNYHITTYTYDPLIGVRSITPPSGVREVYIYDNANRLKEIRERSQTGNILKEFKYNYKP